MEATQLQFDCIRGLGSVLETGLKKVRKRSERPLLRLMPTDWSSAEEWKA
jgi:hypothetical protein